MIDSALLSVVIVLGVAGALTGILLSSKIRSREERALLPLYERRASATFRRPGSLLTAGANIPVFRVALYNDFLVIAGPRRLICRYEDLIVQDASVVLGVSRVKLQTPFDVVYVNVNDDGALVRAISGLSVAPARFGGM